MAVMVGVRRPRARTIEDDGGLEKDREQVECKGNGWEKAERAGVSPEPPSAAQSCTILGRRRVSLPLRLSVYVGVICKSCCHSSLFHGDNMEDSVVA